MTALKLINARRWAALHADERKAPTYIYQTPDAQIVISLVERTATIDGVPLELLEVVQPPCTHPPARQFAWIAYDGARCVGCCQCGKVLAGAAHKELSKTQQEHAWLTDYAKRRLSPPQLDEYLRYLASPSNVTPLAAVGWRDVTLDWLEIAHEEGELTP